MLPLEQCAGSLPLRCRGKRVHHRLRSLLNEVLAPHGDREVADAGREILGCLGLAREPAENGNDRLRTGAKDVVVELFRKRERLPGVRQAGLVAGRPRETTMDRRPERRPRARFAQSLLEQRNGAVDALQLREKDERVGAQRADLRLGQQTHCDRSAACPFARGLVLTSRRERPTMTCVELVARGQSKRLFGELGRNSRGAAT